MRTSALRPILLITTSTFLAGALVACSSATQPPSTLHVSDADDKGAVSLRVGDTLLVTLEGNPTTGYQWEITAVDASILKATGEPQYKPTSSALGAGGQVSFSFDAVASGQTTLEMVYHRIFEKDVPPLHFFTLSIIVR